MAEPPMNAFSLIAIPVIALLLLALVFFTVMTILAWARTRNLTWRVQDLEDAVRRLQQEASLPRQRGEEQRPSPRDVSGDSTAIRE